MIEPRGPFRLADAREFLASFGPAGQRVGSDPDALTLAFAPDDADGAALVVVTQPEADGPVHVDGGHEAQVARILSLDVDPTGWAELVRADPVLRTIGPRRPVLFSSPYEAAAWSVLSARTQVAQAARLRERVVEAAGAAIEHDGVRHLPFPGPAALLATDLPVPEPKAQRLQAIARAALAGELDAERLRAMPPEEAMTAVQQLPGIGPFYAALVVIRGAGAPDALALNEPRMRRAAARAYGDPDLEDPDAFARHAEAWRPWRSWASFALRATAGA
jgi:DNA-3-methyladenine glycosylase II